MLQACATTYRPPIVESTDPSSDTSVKAYIDAHLEAYDRAIQSVGEGQDAAGVGTILAALVGTTAMALGAGTGVGILSGSLGAGINATNGYAKPSDRLQLLGQAVNATICIREEYSNQIGRQQSLGLTASNAVDINSPSLTAAQTFIAGNGHMLHQLGDAGSIAIDATRTVASNLHVKWANVSKIPDYAATVKAIQDAQKVADANKPKDPPAGGTAVLLEQVSEYETSVEKCKSKFPA